MAETTTVDEVTNTQHDSVSVAINEDGKDNDITNMATPDIPNKSLKIESSKAISSPVYTHSWPKPVREEIWVWYLYELCSYFIHTTLIPVLFPLIISQTLKFSPEHATGGGLSLMGLSCSQKEMELYEALTHKSITINNSNFSAMEWTSFSWGIGLVLAAPIIAFSSTYLDHGHNQQLITTAAIAIGAFFCLPTGFFDITWIFPPYIAAIIAAGIIASASHTRQLCIMVRGLTMQPILSKTHFPFRRGVSSWLSLYAAAAGGIGSAIISAFIYHMLSHGEEFVRLWVVSIFSGLIWLAGLSHVIFVKQAEGVTVIPSNYISKISHFLSIFKYPHAFGTLILAFLSSFTTMCIFTSAFLYLIGELCFKPISILICWLTYFIFPMISLPLMHPFQQATKANAVKMNILGFYLSIITAAVGFYFRGKIWHKGFVVVLAGIQSTSVGILHSFGRVMIIDCSPHGKEGVFSCWFSWWRILGSCVGFAVASAMPRNVGTCFAISFFTAIFATLILNFGNVSDLGGAMAAGIVIDEDDEDDDDQHVHVHQKTLLP